MVKYYVALRRGITTERWKKVRLSKFQTAALLFFVAAVFSWVLYYPGRSRFLIPFRGNITSLSVPEWEKIDEKTAQKCLEGFLSERLTLLKEGKINPEAVLDLEYRIRFVMWRVKNSFDRPDQDFECEYDCRPEVSQNADKLIDRLHADIGGYCRTDRGRSFCDQYVKNRGLQIRYNYVVRPHAEAIAIRRYKFGTSIPILLCGILCLIAERIRLFGFKFSRVVGRKVLQFAAHSVALAFSLCGGAAVAQQIYKKAEKERERTGELLDRKKIQSGVKTAGKLTLLDFYSPYRDGQSIAQYVSGKGLVLFGQVVATTDGTTTSGLVATGWNFSGKRLTVALFGGPAFNLKSGEYARQFQVLPTATLNIPRWFSLVSFNKLFVGTDQGKLQGSRHVVIVRGPPGNTNFWLRGVSYHTEMWYSRTRGQWIEQMHGVEFSPGQMLGRKGFWSRFSVWPYWDFSRPQAGRSQRFDMRITYQQTFSFAH